MVNKKGEEEREWYRRCGGDVEREGGDGRQEDKSCMEDEQGKEKENKMEDAKEKGAAEEKEDEK
jgi:hypothetical protein